MQRITSGIADTIEEYKNSRDSLIKRIHELNRQIARQSRRQAGGEVKELTERRRKLYEMTQDIDLAIRLMSEYANDEKKEMAYAG